MTKEIPKHQSIRLASVLAGAQPFKEGNVNDTYRGQILTAESTTCSAILKDLEPKELCNELLASACATALGLPIPTTYLAVVRDNNLPAKKGPKTVDGLPLVLASADVSTPSLIFRLKAVNPGQILGLLKELIAWADLGKLYAFDTWIANIDRHAGNLIFGGKDAIWLIDHGHSFTGPKWTAGNLDPSTDYINRLSEWLTVHMSEDEKANHAGIAAALCQDISALDIAAMLADSGVEPYLTEADRKALNTFLEKRKSETPAKSAKALNYLV